MNYIREIRLSDLPHGEYPFNIPAVRHLKKAGGISLNKPVTFLVGENGTGKSTLIEAIAVAMGFNAEGGSRDFYFNTHTTHSDLHKHLKIVKSLRPDDGFFLRTESFYNTASYLEENSSMLRYGGVSFHEQSHGESFLALVLNRFEGNGLYILDEPEAVRYEVETFDTDYIFRVKLILGFKNHFSFFLTFTKAANTFKEKNVTRKKHFPYYL